MKAATYLTAAMLLVLTCGMVDAAAARPIRVLVDRSHEWLFAYDDLSERMLRPAGCEVVLCDASLDTTTKLKDFDIVLVQQGANAFDFSEEEVRLLRSYVEQGGALVIVANPQLPVVRLTSAFGFTLQTRPCRLPLRSEAWLCESFGAEPELLTRAMSYCVESRGRVRRLLADQDNVAVAMLKDHGKGKVICFVDDGSYWDFCAQRNKDLKVPNVSTTVALFKCLFPDQATRAPGPGVVRIPAERELDLGPLLVRYSNPVARHAQALLELLPKVADYVANANGGKPPTDRFIVNILASGAGGWSGGRELGVQCGGSMGANVAVIAHELTHSWTGPLPGILGEGWASMVGMRAAKAFGFGHDAEEEQRSWTAQFRNAEQNGTTLDITRAEHERDVFGACEGKMMWLVEGMEAKYGADFMPRFLEICRALKGRESPSIQEVIYYFSLTTGTDLTPEFRRLGITLAPPPPIAPAELEARLRSYREEH